MTYGNAGGQPGPPSETGRPDPYSQPGQYGQQPGYVPGGHDSHYGPPGPYVAPGYSQQVARRTNSLAIASLCCGIGQIIAGAIAGIVAIVLGMVALRQINQTGENGRGMAVAGIVLGIVGIVLTVLLVIVILAAFHSAST